MRVLTSCKEVIITSKQNHIKPDVILKNFWKNNERFADLFNAVLFHGEQLLNPSDLMEADTDISSIVTFKEHTETVQKILDVVKKTAYGIDFVIWGLENQMHTHYAMHLRHMLGDALGYFKEYTELTKKNKHEKYLDNSREFLSGMKKTDRLHPVITLCVYYGEEPWDGPFSLLDMLEIPEELKPLVCDYKMNLLQVRDSENYLFHSKDVNTVFDITRNIFQKKHKKINDAYWNQEISSELGLVIGSITASQQLIDRALERKGGTFVMCKALEEWEEEIKLKYLHEGLREGKREGEIIATIKTYKKFNASQEDACAQLQAEYQLNSLDAWDRVKKYWNE